MGVIMQESNPSENAIFGERKILKDMFVGIYKKNNWNLEMKSISNAIISASFNSILSKEKN